MVGNLSNFTNIDILRCLLKIDKPVSRSQLSKTLDLGEGTIRSILDKLKKTKLLESNNKGHFLSAIGNNLVKKIKDDIDMKVITLTNFYPNKKKTAIHIRDPKKIGKTHILRDEAVKNGAEGAIILYYDNKLKVFDSDYEQDFSELENKFDLGKNDLLIVAYADSYKLAEHGAFAVVIHLDKNLRDIIEKFK